MSSTDSTIKIPAPYRNRFKSILIALAGPDNSIYLYTPEGYEKVVKKRQDNLKRHGLDSPGFEKFISLGIVECSIINDKITIPEFLYSRLESSGEIVLIDKEEWVVMKRKVIKECLCKKPLCSKCLSVNCQNSECSIHTQLSKRIWRKS